MESDWKDCSTSGATNQATNIMNCLNFDVTTSTSTFDEYETLTKSHKLAPEGSSLEMRRIMKTRLAHSPLASLHRYKPINIIHINRMFNLA